ncbi:hypothetical protein UFOVP411_36 [uncultured Caudovirales phage]|uniref:Uncharacterized protein n=1 Tax=uncultured Caudovirales phage TaxID=2100421 RepID=A0A6J5M4C3_9CAUD|nr:hypothetical protein UFOVP411_36 [uncultured Caudovirales phage]
MRDIKQIERGIEIGPLYPWATIGVGAPVEWSLFHAGTGEQLPKRWASCPSDAEALEYLYAEGKLPKPHYDLGSF